MSYGVKYFARGRDLDEKNFKVNLLKNGYTGSTSEILYYGVDPLALTYRSSSKDSDEVIHGSELNMTIYSSEGDADRYDELFESNFRDWKVQMLQRPAPLIDTPIPLQSFDLSGSGEDWTAYTGSSIYVQLDSFFGEAVPSKFATWPMHLDKGESVTIDYNYAVSSNTNDYTLSVLIGLMNANKSIIIGSTSSIVTTFPTLRKTGSTTITAVTAATYVFIRATIDYPGFSSHSAHVVVDDLTPNVRTEAFETVVWSGWLQPDNLTRAFVSDNYYINLSATDSLAELKEITFPVSGITSGNSQTRQIEILKTILSQTGLDDLNIYSQLNYTNDGTTSNESLLSETYALTNRFVKTEENGRKKYLSCYDALSYILESYNTRICQSNNVFSIVQKNEIDSPLTKYNITNLSYTRAQRDRTVNIDDFQIVLGTDQLSKAKPIKKINLTFFNKTYDNVLQNGDFDSDIDHWENVPLPPDNNTFDIMAWESVEGNGKMKLQNTTAFGGKYYICSDFFVLDAHGSTGGTLNFSMDFDMTQYAGVTVPARYVYISLFSGNSYSFSGATYRTDIITSPDYYSSKTQFTKTGQLRFTYTGTYYIQIAMWFDQPNWTSTTIYLDNIVATQVYDSEVTTDQFYTGEVSGMTSVNEIEKSIYFADGIQNNDIGALKWNTSGTGQTKTWSNYDQTVTGKSLAYLYLYEKLKSNLRFKNFITITVKASLRDFHFDSVLELQEKKYRIVGYDYSVQTKKIALTLIEILEDDFSMLFTNKSLLSIDGEV